MLYHWIVHRELNNICISKDHSNLLNHRLILSYPKMKATLLSYRCHSERLAGHSSQHPLEGHFLKIAAAWKPQSAWQLGILLTLLSILALSRGCSRENLFLPSPFLPSFTKPSSELGGEVLRHKWTWRQSMKWVHQLIRSWIIKAVTSFLLHCALF